MFKEPSLETLIFPFKKFCKEKCDIQFNQYEDSFEFGIKIKNGHVNSDWITFYMHPLCFKKEFAQTWISSISGEEKAIQLYDETEKKYHPSMGGLYYFGYEKGIAKEFYYLYTSFDLSESLKNEWNFHYIFGDTKLEQCQKYTQIKEIMASFINPQTLNTIIKKTHLDSSMNEMTTFYIPFEPIPLQNVKNDLIKLVNSINNDLNLTKDQLENIKEYIEYYSAENKYNFTLLAFSIDDPSKFSIYIRHGK